MSIRVNAWVNAVSWSPSNLYCYIATQDSVMTVVNTSSQNSINVNLYHSPICYFVPVSDYSVYAISFDRHIYEYTEDEKLNKEENNFNWVCKRNITGGIYPVRKTPTTETGSKSVSETKTSIMDVMKKFEAGNQKKQSLIITSTSNQNIHSAQVNSANLVNDTIVTTDYAGFLKLWKI